MVISSHHYCANCLLDKVHVQLTSAWPVPAVQHDMPQRLRNHTAA